MSQEKVAARSTFVTPAALRVYGAMLAITGCLLIPMFGFSQNVTGTLVNFILFTTAMTVGIESACIAGSFSATSALVKGVLFGPFTAALAPMIPFIIAGNAIMVVGYAIGKKIHPLVGIAAGALIKFAFLYLTSTEVVAKHVKLPAAILSAMSWPQLLTACVGGLLAYLAVTGVKAARKSA